MHAQVNGSNAYKYGEAAPERKKSTKRAPQSIKKNRAQKRRAAFANAMMIICVTSLAFLILFRYAIITEKCSYVEELRKEYQKLHSAVVQKQFETEKNIDLATVEQIAKTRLNMQRPEKHQTVYIDMESSDYVEVADKDGAGDGIFALFMGRLSEFLEYLH